MLIAVYIWAAVALLALVGIIAWDTYVDDPQHDIPTGYTVAFAVFWPLVLILLAICIAAGPELEPREEDLY